MKPELVNNLPTFTGQTAAVSAPRPAAKVNADPVRQDPSVAGEKRPQSERLEPQESADLEKTVSELNDYVQNMKRSLQFSVDDDTGRTIIKVIDPESKEVIRQIPREEILAIARMLREQTQGALLEERA